MRGAARALEADMPIPKEYMFYAEQCRTFARRTSDATHREILLKMAETWEQLAKKSDISVGSTNKGEPDREPEPEERPS